MESEERVMKAGRVRAGWFVLVLAATAGAQTTELESRTVVVGNSSSGGQSISADGRFVAFVSNASNLVAGDTNGGGDVFVLEVATGAIDRVSVSTAGAQANQPCAGQSISGDGRYVVFTSPATNLVAGDVNGKTDVFLRDRQNATTTIVSVAAGGVQANADCDSPCISPDGRFVAFRSVASNLVAGDTNGVSDVFVRDLQANTIQRASLATGGSEANGGSYAPAITPDGRYVAFTSDATNLAAGDTNFARDVFVHDFQTNATVRASLSATGQQPNNGCYEPIGISADGRFALFHSGASNLVAGDTNGTEDVFVRDLQAGTTEIESVGQGSTPSNNASYSCAISPDARYVLLASYASNLVAGDTNGFMDVFVRDRQSGTTARASIATNGAQGDQATTFTAAISADGNRVVFASSATTLFPGDGNGVMDVFLRDFHVGATTIVSSVSQSADGKSAVPVVSADGNLVAFQSTADDLVPGDGNFESDVFVRNRAAGTVERVSLSTSGGDTNGPSYAPVMTPDGRYVAFASRASNITANDFGNYYDVFLRDRVLGTNEMVSVGANGVHGSGDSGYWGGGPFSMGISISPDGRYVTFVSFADNLDPRGGSSFGDVYVRDRVTGTTENVSLPWAGTYGDSSTYEPSISADGRYVVFMSLATNLVPGDTNAFPDVFLRDRQAGTTTRISMAADGGESNGASSLPVISADGRFVAFNSNATNLLQGGPSTGGLFVWNLATHAMELASVSSTGVSGGCYGPSSISSDGRFVVFTSGSSNLVPGDTNGVLDVFLRDRTTRSTSLVSLSTGGAQGNADSGTQLLQDHDVDVALSPDGRFVTFTSLASNLVANDGNGYSDIILRDRGADSAFAPFCFGDGTGAACPCANSGAPGHGCENSSTTGGAVLAATGAASLSADSVHFTCSGEKPTATSVLLQGTITANSIHYGDGLRCVGGTLKRLYIHTAVGGFATFPQGAEPGISARSASAGDAILLGTTRNYQVYYRDPSATFCPTPSGSTFNISSAIAIAWGV